MIKVSTLKKLLEQVPDEALVSAYEGEDIGINIDYKDKNWWIRANPYPQCETETYTEGFEKP